MRRLAAQSQRFLAKAQHVRPLPIILEHLGIALAVVVLSHLIGAWVGATFGAHFVVALVASRGRHYSWVVFLAIAVLAVMGTG